MSEDRTYKMYHLASLLSEQKIRVPIAIGIVAKNKSKSNTKKLC